MAGHNKEVSKGEKYEEYLKETNMKYLETANETAHRILPLLKSIQPEILLIGGCRFSAYI